MANKRNYPIPTKNKLFQIFSEACKPLSNGAIKQITHVDTRLFKHLVDELESESYIETVDNFNRRALTAKGHSAAVRNYRFPDGDITPEIKLGKTARELRETINEQRLKKSLKLSRFLFLNVFEVRRTVW